MFTRQPAGLPLLDCNIYLGNISDLFWSSSRTDSDLLLVPGTVLSDFFSLIKFLAPVLVPVLGALLSHNRMDPNLGVTKYNNFFHYFCVYIISALTLQTDSDDLAVSGYLD